MLEHVLSKIRNILEEARLNLSSDMAAPIEKLVGDIEKLINFIHREIVTIESDRNLNPSERRAAKRALLENAGRKLEVIKTKRSYTDLEDELKSKLLKPSVPEKEKNALLKFLREREVRDRLFGMTEAQIKSHFGDSLFDGSNLLLLDAILNAPAGFEQFQQSTLKKLRWIRAVKLNPEMASQLEMAREMNSTSQIILKLAKKELDSARLREIPLSFSEKANTD
ncbi:MAG: hypothetical protein PVF37_03460 [Desulfobacterales bacterium]|jgi:hypothetical protein